MVILLIITLILLGTTSCVPGNGRATVEEPAGFFWGVWHGWIAPISLIASIFRDELSVYEVNNTGFWYDLGFYMAVISGFGGLGAARGRNRRKHGRREDEE
jgi:hypothetical protein